jgi:hypothetical protein
MLQASRPIWPERKIAVSPLVQARRIGSQENLFQVFTAITETQVGSLKMRKPAGSRWTVCSAGLGS